MDHARHCQRPGPPRPAHRAEPHLRRRQRAPRAAIDGGGGGAIFARGGRLKVVNCRFFNNVCDDLGPDVGGGAIRALEPVRTGLPGLRSVATAPSAARPASATRARTAAPSAASASPGHVLNSLLLRQQAVGDGANPARTGTPGGGSGGAIYNDGNTFIARRSAAACIENNNANEGGGAIFFVSNDRTGSITIDRSTLRDNPSAASRPPATRDLRARQRPAVVTGSTIAP